MLIVHVFVHVKPAQVEAFKAATLENGWNSAYRNVRRFHSCSGLVFRNGGAVDVDANEFA